MSKVIRITKTEERFTFYGGTYLSEEVHYRKTENEALEYIEKEYKNSHSTLDFKIEHVDFDENDKKSINCLIPEKKKWKK